MKAAYKIFFLIYGGVHIIAGIVIALWPGVLNIVLSNDINYGASALVGIFAAMAGLGFYGAAFENDLRSKIVFVRLAIGANILNGLGHAVNASRGESPLYMGYVGAFGVAVIIGILIFLHRGLTKTPAS